VITRQGKAFNTTETKEHFIKYNTSYRSITWCFNE